MSLKMFGKILPAAKYVDFTFRGGNIFSGGEC